MGKENPFSLGLRSNLETVATPSVEYSSAILVGGVGFGDFDPASSDIDVWIITPNAPVQERLYQAVTLNEKFNQVEQALIDTGIVQSHAFRHPPTFLTESESLGYRKAFAAKLGLPISLGVFSTFSGLDRKGETPFTEEELVKDLAYSCYVFYSNIKNLPQASREPSLRYSYKRTTYFLRFVLLSETGLYVPLQANLLDTVEQRLPQWRPALEMLRDVYTNGNTSKRDEAYFRGIVSSLMEQDMDNFRQAGLLNDLAITKGQVRARLFWTLEKTRWDFILADRNPSRLKQIMSSTNPQGWGFPFKRINELMEQAFLHIPSKSLSYEWQRFASEHETRLKSLPDEEVGNYFEEIYSPSLISFFDRLIPFIQFLY